MFYDLQIWNVSPPSCPRLHQAQLVRATYEHSPLLIHTTYKKPVWARKQHNWPLLQGGNLWKKNFENCQNVRVAIGHTHSVCTNNTIPESALLRIYTGPDDQMSWAAQLRVCRSSHLTAGLGEALWFSSSPCLTYIHSQVSTRVLIESSTFWEIKEKIISAFSVHSCVCLFRRKQ